MDVITTYEIVGELVYVTKTWKDGTIKECLGGVTKTETVRIDNTTVEDIVYTFDLEQGKYVEVSRTKRTDVLMPSDIDLLGMQLVEKDLQILDLQQQNAALGSSLVNLELRLLALEGGA